MEAGADDDDASKEAPPLYLREEEGSKIYNVGWTPSKEGIRYTKKTLV